MTSLESHHRENAIENVVLTRDPRTRADRSSDRRITSIFPYLRYAKHAILERPQLMAHKVSQDNVSKNRLTIIQNFDLNRSATLANSSNIP